MTSDASVPPAAPAFPPAGSAPVTRYRLDAGDRIVEVGGAWDRFACENGAEDLAGEQVIGLPLRSFIAGDVTRMFIDTLLARVRLTGRPAVVPYRCDSPGLKRFMEMSLTLEGRSLLAEHRLVGEQPLPRPLTFRTATAGGRWVRRCSMCNRVATRDGAPLVEPECLPEAAATVCEVIYGVCAECRERVRRRLGG